MCHFAQHMCCFFILCATFRHICAKTHIYVPLLISPSVLKFKAVLFKDKLSLMLDKLQSMLDKSKILLDKFTAMLDKTQNLLDIIQKMLDKPLRQA
jgi:hypothetical protein